ncbi:hypothetical protein K8I85_04795 [bacterium]|nr:hypothetical protein [bacterium]
MNVRPLRSLLLCLLVLVPLVSGCDPKLIGTDTGTGGSGGTGGTGGTPATVTPEALIVGNMISFHTDLIGASLALSADFDSASTSTRSLDTACATVTPLSSGGVYEILFDGCSDAHGTQYRGGGELWVINNQDGFTYLPLFDEDLLRATNETDDNYNYTTLSPATTAGSLEFTFERESGVVTAVQVGKFLRHGVRGDTVTLSYADVHYTGGVGSHPARPDAGSVVRVVWDGVGLFDVEFQGNGTATYTMQGGNYEVELSNGDVSVSGT